jgi:hypothetical protein
MTEKSQLLILGPRRIFRPGSPKVYCAGAEKPEGDTRLVGRLLGGIEASPRERPLTSN